MLTKKDKLNAEMKLLTAIYAREVFEGHTVRQEKPHCCGKVIDIFQSEVTFREIIVGKRAIHLLEPRCPNCLKRVKASFQLIS
jgi:hypothetical protein